ncbi:TetR/AcrR family transcriptional regulator [Brachybacterium aquaticum]|uniref:AcrR family transcriptional regulator n=1 Tax=Brachybacterium aquaticum TaxID=1432564 RepID=A0A841AGK4_9MICO|nr:TetR/AcrR family transcriptional regulator [Brachybacterium aquaticum]MBB5833057.1 AcrR family transcriptional regulator [Brachybacterium aquaticum]
MAPADPARPAHRPSAREAMLAAAEAHLGADGTLTLDSAARAAGVTKPGLMYHFATKEELLAAVLERIAERYEREMLAEVAVMTGENPGEISAEQRVLAYLDWACRADLSAADLVIFADPHLRVALTERWQGQIERWLLVPADAPAPRRARLLAVRLMADGLWFDRASGLLETSADEAPALRTLAEGVLVEGRGAA